MRMIATYVNPINTTMFDENALKILISKDNIPPPKIIVNKKFLIKSFTNNAFVILLKPYFSSMTKLR